VDDEEQNVYMLRQILERLGYRTTGRTSGLEALGAFRGEPDQFNLIITDMTMPGMDGAQLAEKLLEIRTDIPIILCAGFSETISEEKAKSLGIRQIVMKPTVTDELATAIRRVLGMDFGGSSRFTILVVDDDETLRMMLRQHLEDAGYNVLDATNGKEALQNLASEPANLVLTDVRMPEMDGFELMAHISADYPSIPVMVMSAYGTPETTKRFKEMGSMQVLDKPVDLDDLTRRITETLHQVSQGGTMTGISVSSFLQLIEMEEKSCVLEVHGQNRQKGFLYFSQGKLCDAVCDQLRGEEATLEIISWENVLLSFNALPQKKIQRKIKMDLMSLLLEGLKLKDETRA
jgi:CheY-like chemotaxis protein